MRRECAVCRFSKAAIGIKRARSARPIVKLSVRRSLLPSVALTCNICRFEMRVCARAVLHLSCNEYECAANDKSNSTHEIYRATLHNRATDWLCHCNLRMIARLNACEVPTVASGDGCAIKVRVSSLIDRVQSTRRNNNPTL